MAGGGKIGGGTTTDDGDGKTGNAGEGVGMTGEGVLVSEVTAWAQIGTFTRAQIDTFTRAQQNTSLACKKCCAWGFMMLC